MSAEAIRDLVRRQLFVPFVVRLSNGETHEIRHPECIVVGKTTAVVYDPEDDRFVFCSLIHIKSVEALQPT